MEKQLKMERIKVLTIVFAITAVILMVATITESELFGTYYSPWIWGGLLLVFGYFSYRYTANLPQIMRVILFSLYVIIGTAVWHYELGVHMDTFLTKETFYIHAGLMALVIILFFPATLYYKSRMKTHYRKILELAAKGVSGTENGFTSRPYPVGKMQYNLDEIVHLARFLAKKQVAVPRIEENRVLLLFSADSLVSSENEREDQSSVVFYRSGEVTVHISRSDYSRFREQLTFEELCDSVARVFYQFLETFRNGQGQRIIKELDSMESRRTKWFLIGIGIILFILFIILVIIYFLKVFNPVL